MAQWHVAPDEAEVLADGTPRLRLWLTRPIADARLQPRSDPCDRIPQALHPQPGVILTMARPPSRSVFLEVRPCAATTPLSLAQQSSLAVSAPESLVFAVSATHAPRAAVATGADFTIYIPRGPETLSSSPGTAAGPVPSDR